MARLWTGETRVIEVPVFMDGNYSDIERIEIEPDEPPAPTDADYLAAHPWHDDRAGYPGETAYPEHDVPVVDYDPRFSDVHYEGL